MVQGWRQLQLAVPFLLSCMQGQKRPWGWGWGSGQGRVPFQEENRSQKLFVSHWSLLCDMQLKVEIMDWNKPLEAKDSGYFFYSLST